MRRAKPPDQVVVELEARWLTSLATVPGAFRRVIGTTTRQGWRPTAVQAAFLADLQAVAPVRHTA